MDGAFRGGDGEIDGHFDTLKAGHVIRRDGREGPDDVIAGFVVHHAAG